MIKNIAILIGVAAVLAAVSAFVHPRRPAWYKVSDPAEIQWSISVESAREIQASAPSVLWVDARSRVEFEKSHLAGAVLINEQEFSDLMFQNQTVLQDAMGNPVIVYCDGAGCDKSKVIAERLRELIGLQPVYVLKGDWQDVETP